MTDVSGLYPLQPSLVEGSYIKMLLRRVLSDRYRITQEIFQYHRVEMCMTFRVYMTDVTFRALHLLLMKG